jgi:hypothetical protein
MPSGKTWKYLSIGFIVGIVGSVCLAVASVAILASLSSKPSASGVVLSDIGCPSGMVENLATSRCEATDQTISVINNSFHKHSGTNPVPSIKRMRELASKIADNKGRFSAYRIAALLGDAESQYEVGGMLSWGTGTEEDDLEALRWLHEAAHNGYLEAQVRLAQMLSSGTYVKKDQRLARVWQERAEANKNHKTKRIAELKV